MRSVERTVESVLLPAVELLLDGSPIDTPADPPHTLPTASPAPPGPGSPEYRFPWRYATGWLAAASASRRRPRARRAC